MLREIGEVTNPSITWTNTARYANCSIALATGEMTRYLPCSLRHLRFADGPDEVQHMVVGRAEVQKYGLW